VREGGGQLAMGLGLCEQRVGLGLKRLHGVSAGSEARRWLLERSELHKGAQRHTHPRREVQVRSGGHHAAVSQTRVAHDGGPPPQSRTTGRNCKVSGPFLLDGFPSKTRGTSGRSTSRDGPAVAREVRLCAEATMAVAVDATGVDGTSRIRRDAVQL
jgi:hypothetical protein